MCSLELLQDAADFWGKKKKKNLARFLKLNLRFLVWFIFTSFANFAFWKYHTGSMAFGATFVTMFQSIVLEHLEDKTRANKIFSLLLTAPLSRIFSGVTVFHSGVLWHCWSQVERDVVCVVALWGKNVSVYKMLFLGLKYFSRNTSTMVSVSFPEMQCINYFNV